MKVVWKFALPKNGFVKKTAGLHPFFVFICFVKNVFYL